MTFLTYWNGGAGVMFCINTPASMEKNLITTLEKEDPTPLDARDPFAMYIPLMDEIVKLYDESVWSIRDVLRRIEKIREFENMDILNLQYESDFSEFQEIMRHSIHIGEVLSVSTKNIGEMRQCREDLLRLFHPEARQDSAADNKPRVWDKTDQRMKLHAQIFGNLKHRQESNHERLRTEISLAYNLGAQRDSKVLKADSKAMKTVASLTMVYLPATFVSAIFSMSFFNFSPADGDKPERWTHSSKWWLFLVGAAAATAVTVLVWYILQNIEPKDVVKDLVSKDWWKDLPKRWEDRFKRMRQKNGNNVKAAEA
ncbi:hypothetical protein K432DRAFT_387294 [Lepidopterella palustris CBS 459.81]|uniref:Mg2+ transporter protein, CorA-like/Zinc transport protein ZntB n=1 Tax=Lepidopterella palustris CBS 459.81 TaxID=1314670 RepID=A0A8E2DXN0_9PEZI|nr:hypothetical protein K432DRAFT_387294 [Lepidopterella palustris CBS 459.81]